MSIEEALNEIFNIEKQKEFEESLLKLIQKLVIIANCTIILKNLNAIKTLNQIFQQKEIIKVLESLADGSLEETNDTKTLRLLTKKSERIKQDTLFLLKEKEEFFKFLRDFDIGPEIKDTIEEILVGIERIKDLLTQTEYKTEYLQIYTQIKGLSSVLGEKSIYFADRTSKEPIFKFFNAYLSKDEKGESLTLSDIKDIIDELLKLDIAKRIVLKIKRN